MKFMGWSWQDFMSAPDEIVQEIIRLINAKAEEDELRQLMNQ